MSPRPPSRDIATAATKILSQPIYAAASHANEPKAKLYIVYITSSYRDIFQKNCGGVYEELGAVNAAVMDEYEMNSWKSSSSLGAVSKDGGFWWSIRDEDSRINEGWMRYWKIKGDN
jgi:hypothetical protein